MGWLDTVGNLAGNATQAGQNSGAGVATGALALGEYFINKKQQKKDEANRPKYEIPPEVSAGLSEAQRQALQGLPEEQKQQYITNLQRGAAYSLSQSSSRKGGLQGISALNENQNTGYANLLSQDAQARMVKQQNVFGQLDNMANYKGQQFQLNQLNPYYEHIARSSANRGALFQNLNKSTQLAMSGNGGAQPSYQGQAKSIQATPYSITPVYNTMPNGQVSSTPNINAGQQELNPNGLKNPNNDNIWNYKSSSNSYI